MLDIKSAKVIANSINQAGFECSLEDACRMQPITISTRSSGYTILGLQRGDLTILVWVDFDVKLGVMVRRVKSQSW